MQLFYSFICEGTTCGSLLKGQRKRLAPGAVPVLLQQEDPPVNKKGDMLHSGFPPFLHEQIQAPSSNNFSRFPAPLNGSGLTVFAHIKIRVNKLDIELDFP